MKTTHRILFFLLLLPGFGSVARAQSPAPDTSRRLLLRGEVQNQRVYLRWAASSPTFWQQANAQGYTVRRKTIRRNGLTLTTPTVQVLTPTPLKPNTNQMRRLDSLNQANDPLVMIWGALEGIVDTTGYGSQNMPTDNSLLEQRFMLGLMAADQDFAAARIAGWAFVDSTTVPGEVYGYEVVTGSVSSASSQGVEPSADCPTPILERSNIIAPGQTVVDSACVQIRLKPGFAAQLGSNYRARIGWASATPGSSPDVGLVLDPSQNLVPPAFAIQRAVADSGRVTLVWNYDSLQTQFVGYWVERSTNNVQFTRLNTRPVTKLTDQTPFVLYADSLPQNYRRYYYRLVGKTLFGTEKPSPVKVAEGWHTADFSPRLGANPTTNGMEFGWDLPYDSLQIRTADSTLIERFVLTRSADDKPPFQAVASVTGYAARRLVVPNPEATGYYRLQVITWQKDTVSSPSLFYQVADSTAPAPPVSLAATIDTSGVVNLTWAANQESDLLGYRVFRAFQKDEEPSQITADVITTAAVTDTVSLTTTNMWVYYRVVAVDKRFNESAYSVVLAKRKPDKIPPSAPSFVDYSITNDGVRLQWANSFDSDVVRHSLYRREYPYDTTWVLVAHVNTDTTQRYTTYADGDAESDRNYVYSVLAEDEAGLKSLPASPLLVQVPSNARLLPSVTGLVATVDTVRQQVKLAWDLINSLPAGSEFQLYKGLKDGQITLLSTLPAPSDEFIDRAVEDQTQYQYALRYVSADGRQSGWRKLDVTVQYGQ